MKTSAYLIAAMITVALLYPAIASADPHHRRPHYSHRGSSHVGISGEIVIGAPYWWGGYYYGYPRYYPYPPYYPYYTQPPVIIQEQKPQIYSEPPAPVEPEAYWYYCEELKGYYPYIKECPGGWKKVAPTPPPSEGDK